MELKGRLSLVADKVPLCQILSDIGTDHAYIPIFLVGNGTCQRGIASDIKKGPTLIAKRNIKKYKLEDRIDVRIGGGLSSIREEEIDVVVIAGMGGLMICDILKDDQNKANKAKKIIIQAMNAIELVREWLYQNSFEITDEALVAEGHKIYTVIVCEPASQPLHGQDMDYYISPMLIKNKDPLLKKYLEYKIKQLDRILEGLRASKNSEAMKELERYLTIQNEMKVRLQEK